MKNQYLADIGDFGKYGLLRYLSNQGIKISVNWYLTTDDTSNDGHFRKYLENNRYSEYDCELFDVLRWIYVSKYYDVRVFENKQLIPNAIYYHAFIDTLGWANKPSKERLSERIEWHRQALKLLKGSELVFLDPDNGLCKKRVNGWLNSRKYVFLDEAYDYYKEGSDIVYYCHKGRRDQFKWTAAINALKSKDPLIHIRAISFHKGTQMTYVFAVHPERAEKYDCIIKDFLQTNWGRNGLFTNEF